MRKALESPPFDPVLLREVVAQAIEAYFTMEQGQSCDSLLKGLEELTGRTIHPFELHSAFSSIRPEAFAKQLLTSETDFLSDLTPDEMLELLNRVTHVRGDEYQLSYWIECLKRSTGNPRISDLIYWPGHYFGDGDETRDLSDQEILEIALRDGHAV